MKCYIADTLIGIFAFDEIGNILSFIDAIDNSKIILDFYEYLEKGKLLDDYKQFLFELKNSGYDEFVFDNKDLEQLTKNLRLKIELNNSSLEFKNFRLHLGERLELIGIDLSEKELLAKYKKTSEILTKIEISRVGAKGDVIIIQIIETLESIKKSISLFSMRLREWYGLHFPELTDKTITDDILLARLVSVLGKRKNFFIDKIKTNFNLSDRLIDNLGQMALNSMGADLNVKIIQEYSNQILSLEDYRIELEHYLDNLMEKTAPNLKAIVGSLIGAKLINKAGSLKKLAFLPASRIQLLGAEKALYRFLKTGEKIPKHGLIFQWKQIRSKMTHIRGKIARLVAGKIAICAKIDYFSGEFIGDILSKEIDEKIKEIEKKYPKPSKKIKTKPTRTKKIKKRRNKRRKTRA